MHHKLAGLSLLLLAGACAPAPGAGELAGGDLEDGAGLTENDPGAAAVVRLANEADQVTLDVDVGLTSTAAKNIVKHRAGDDGELDTGDDDLFDSLAELDAVPYVGSSALAKLLAYAEANGYLELGWRTQVASATVSDDPTLCQFIGPDDASRVKLFLEATNDFEGYSIQVIDEAGILRQTLSAPFSTWSRELRGRTAGYRVLVNGTPQACQPYRDLLMAAQVQVPVDPADAYACAVTNGLEPVSDDGFYPGHEVIAAGALPVSPSFSTSAAPSSACGVSGDAVMLVPPVDGEYTIVDPTNPSYASPSRHISYEARTGGCSSDDVICGSSTSSEPLKLRGGVPVIIRFSQSSGSTARDRWKNVAIIRATTEDTCDDSFDGDGDGAIDCDDSDCAYDCAGPEICDNGIDDNGDGAIDCMDDDCDAASECSVNTCPGADLGDAVSNQDGAGPYVAHFNNSAISITNVVSCSGDEWPNSRFFRWRAPANGTYRFAVSTVSGENNSLMLRVLESCGGYQIECAHANSVPVVGAAAGEELIVEVNMATGPIYTGVYGLSVTRVE